MNARHVVAYILVGGALIGAACSTSSSTTTASASASSTGTAGCHCGVAQGSVSRVLGCGESDCVGGERWSCSTTAQPQDLGPCPSPSSSSSGSSSSSSSSSGACSCAFTNAFGMTFAVIPCGTTSDCVDGGDYLTCSDTGEGMDQGSCTPVDCKSWPSGTACSADFNCCANQHCCLTPGATCLNGYCCSPIGGGCSTPEDCCPGGTCDTSIKPWTCK